MKMIVVCIFTIQDFQEKNLDSSTENMYLPSSWGDTSLLVLFNELLLIGKNVMLKEKSSGSYF